MFWAPHVTVAAIIESEHRFLLVEEEAEGKAVVFNQPAGHLDEGESLIQAVIRETLEETAWHFEPQHVVGIYQYQNPISHSSYLRVCFAGQVQEHEPNRPLDTGILQAVWLTRAEIANKHNLRSPMVLRCVDDYLAGARYPLSLLTHLL